MANANFTPDIGPYTTLKPFRFWCQKVLPLVYDDSLSYYELLGKVVDYLNKTMEDVDTQITDIQGLLSAYEALQGWVNAYYTSADFAAAIDDGLDRMAESGQLTALINAIIAPQLPDIVDLLLPEAVMTLLPDEVSSQIPGTVANQLPAVVSNQIPGTVANQLPAVVSNQIGPVVEDKIVDPVEDWLDANVSGGIAVDRTLSVLGAGADAAFTGARLESVDNAVGYDHVSDTGFFITTTTPYAFNSEIIVDNASFSDLASHTYKMIVIPVTTGDKYCINAHKISIANITTDHFAVTYAFCAKYVGIPGTDVPYYLPTTYSAVDAENVIATVPEINIPAGQGYDETTGYLVVITGNIEDPVYKIGDSVAKESEITALRNDLGNTVSQRTIDIGNLVNGEYVTADGSFASYGGWSRTDYIDCSTWIEVTNSNGGQYNAFYDENHLFVGRCIFSSEVPTVTIPTNAKYVVFSGANQYITVWTYNATIEGMGYDLYNKIDELNDIVNTDTYGYPPEVIQNAFISSSGTLTQNAAGYAATPFLDLPYNENQDFEIRGTVYGNACCCIYDADHNLLLAITENNQAQYGGASYATSGLQILTIPYINGMKYARLSAKNEAYSQLTDLWTRGNTLAGAFKRIANIETDLKAVESNVSTAISQSKVLVIGDSISADAYGSYPKWVTDLINEGFLPADTTNSSQHATGFVARYDSQPNDFITRLKAIETPSQYDLVIVFGGINDYIQNVPMGSDAGTDYTVSFKPAVNEFFNYLIQNFTQARLCVLLPLRNYQNWQNSVGEYQQAYAEYIKQVAKSYCLPVLNLTEDSGFCPYIATFSNMWTLIPQGYSAGDGVHPNQEYQRKYLAPMIRHFLQGLL